MSKIFLEILDPERQRVFDKLSRFKKLGYLAGETALSLQINHRKSYDFDVFINKKVDNSLRLKVKKLFRNIFFYVNTGDQISFNLKNGIGVTFVWYYHKALNTTVKTASISLASVEDIAADKAHTIGRRAQWRDYVDVFILLKREIVDLGKIITLANKKFKGEFNELLFLEQLVYFHDLEETPIEYVGTTYTSSEIKSFLEIQVKGYVKMRLRS